MEEVESMFNNEDAKRILGIPLSYRNPRDRRVAIHKACLVAIHADFIGGAGNAVRTLNGITVRMHHITVHEAESENKSTVEDIVATTKKVGCDHIVHAYGKDFISARHCPNHAALIFFKI